MGVHTMTNTDWIAADARVAELVPSRSGGASGVHPATIARVTATQIHLDNGNRYNRKTLNPAGKGNSGAGGYPGTKLVPISDPDVQRSLALKELDRVSMTASRAHRKGAADVADVLAALDEIAQAVRAARQAITGKEA